MVEEERGVGRRVEGNHLGSHAPKSREDTSVEVPRLMREPLAQQEDQRGRGDAQSWYHLEDHAGHRQCTSNHALSGSTRERHEQGPCALQMRKQEERKEEREEACRYWEPISRRWNLRLLEPGKRL